MLWLVWFSAVLGGWAETLGAAGTSAEIPQIRLILAPPLMSAEDSVWVGRGCPVHWWWGLGEAPGGEGAETDLTEGPQETAPAGAEGQFVPCDDTLGLGALSRRVPAMSKGQSHVSGCKQGRAPSTMGREAKDPRQPKPGGPCHTWAPAKPP